MVVEELRGYQILYYDELQSPYIQVKVSADQDVYLSTPTPEEARGAFDLGSETNVVYNSLFSGKSTTAYPRIPTGGGSYQNYFKGSGVVIAPAIPKGDLSVYYMFRDCTSLKQPALIPRTARGVERVYSGCTSLQYPVSIPDFAAGSLTHFYENCTNMTGEFVCRRTSGSVTDCLKDTTKPITIYGDKTKCEAIAATANNGNAQWSAWYDPIPAVTDRGAGSRTTAADMTRMVRNGVLAVPTYAPGKMAYQQNDIVRIDEWNALVEAAQTIDPTVTYSTNYSNLNQIEAAFDSAL